MKHIIPVALLIGAAPALLFGQVTVDCPEETCQIAPYYVGNGGFVGEAANVDDEDTEDVDESEVSFHVVCDNVTISTSAAPDGDGIVRQALNTDGGLSCRPGTRGRLEIDNLLPGGWYWINDDENSAVSALIPKAAAGNEQIVPTDPGGVVLDSESNGIGTYVKEPASGRVGIIPHIVPTRPIKGCSGMVGEESATDCHLGSPEGWRLRASPSSVIRPTGAEQPKPVVVTLYGENFLTTATIYGRAEVDHHTSVEGILFNQSTGAAPPEGQPGVLGWSVSVAPDDNRCLPSNNDPDRGSAQTVTFRLAELDGVIPGPGADTVETTFTVTCPDDSAASAGAELVPENPFPVGG